VNWDYSIYLIIIGILAALVWKNRKIKEKHSNNEFDMVKAIKEEHVVVTVSEAYLKELQHDKYIWDEQDGAYVIKDIRTDLLIATELKEGA
jgi:hypothetical protein